MTESIVVNTDLRESVAAGAQLGRGICGKGWTEPPDAVIVFASPIYDYVSLLTAISNACRPKTLVGCSSAGEFLTGRISSSSACAVAIWSKEIKFSVGLGKGLRTSPAAAAKQIVSSFRRTGTSSHHLSALVLTDALAGHTEEFLEQLTLATAGRYQLFGGGAGDDARFQRTHVFCGVEAITDAAVALEMVSEKPFGIGFHHGWTPASDPMRVTEADGVRLISLNAAPAVEAFQEFAESTGQQFNMDDPMPFFLQNIIGIDTPAGYKLRVPLCANADGSIDCAAEVPTGSTVCLMKATSASAADAAADATQSALSKLDGVEASVALFFDCAATRLRLGGNFLTEVDRVQKILGPKPLAGCNTYGQIARSEGQFTAFHNCTAVVCILPQ